MICIGQDESQKPFQNSIALSGGFGITNGNPIRRLGISFDRIIKNNWVLNGSVLIDGSQSSWHSGNVISNDSLIITSDWRIESSNQMIKLGAKKYLFDFFYLGADFNLGIYTRTNVSRERQLDYDSDHDEWSYSSIIDPSQTSGGIWYSYTALEINRYLNYGLSLKIGIHSLYKASLLFVNTSYLALSALEFPKEFISSTIELSSSRINATRFRYAFSISG